MRQYFVGEWHGAGKFGDGQRVHATLVFSADSAGLVGRHRDVSKGMCAMEGRWRRQAKTGKVSLWLTGGKAHGKIFIGDGLRNGLMVVLATFLSSGNETIGERYTYRILGASRLE